MPLEIVIPETASAGGILAVQCIGYQKGHTAFSGILGKNPRTGNRIFHGHVQKSVTADWFQVEQENSKQEAVQQSKDDGVIHFELKGKDGKPLKPGKYVVHAVATNSVGLGSADKIGIVTVI